MRGRWMVLAGLCLVGCDDGETGAADMAHAHADQGHTPGDLGAADGHTGIQGDTWAPGLTKMGAGGLRVRLLASDPDPLTRTQHTWDFAVLEGDAELAECDVTVTPFMPDHGHGANTAPTVTETGVGAYRAAPIDLFMRGLWTVDFDLTCGARSDTVQFAFWIED